MDRFISSAVTVGKVILVSVVGIWISQHFHNKEKSLKALSYISVKIFLPCLLFSQLAKDLSWDMIHKYYWACILPLIPMILGFCTALAFRSFIPAELHGLLQLSCTFQSIVSYGLGIVLNLDISWWSKEDRSEAQSYVFLFNLLHSLFLWSFGTMIVEKGAMALEEMKATAAVATAVSAEDDGDDAITSMRKTSGALVEMEECFGAESHQSAGQLEAYQPAPEINSTRDVVERENKTMADLTWPEYIRVQLPYLLSEQIIASFLGLLVALVPPFYLLAKNPVGEVLMGGISFLAPGAVPLQLLVLGVNVTADDEADSKKLPIRFLVVVILLRLVFIPAICFCIIHVLVVNALMPYDKPFILVMLILTSAPTAINTSSICSIYSYKVKEYTKVLLFMYMACIFTTTVWLTVYVWYLDS
ncbi:transporter, putative [Trypanosoma cruzi]|uniref:Transporter n=2 Tax=Trypanosoma cruzi TaxID=5693 RepID=V5B7J7_TRYCR|nr:transporter, putative [Trypanosoma cruzi]ESS61987.1 transporter [Trypanosoma cruzi Dm28c]PBJ70132.1 transporter [Trypanosoma cruzi cruzi]PWV01363.1 putative transporter [Trypanosoma cruzi]RNF24070.1 putative transporter [Trypanosoma cruzi]